ncbi:triple tyrosine motif-containing protein [Pseudomonadota bacterium]
MVEESFFQTFFGRYITSSFRSVAVIALAFTSALYNGKLQSSSSYIVRPWPLSQQLAQETIVSILHTNKGSLWIATLAGIDRFDGTGFTQYRPNRPENGFIASANIFELLKTSSEKILAVTKDAGVLAYDTDTDSFVSIIPSLDNFEDTKRISSSFVDEQDDVWIGYENGELARLSIRTGRLINLATIAENAVTGITRTTSGRMFAATSKGQIFEIFGNLDYRHFGVAEAMCPGLHSALDEIAAGSDESIWLGSKNDGAFIIDVEESSCLQLHHQLKNGSNIDKSDVHQIYLDQNDSSTWVATDQGLFHIDRSLRIRHIATSADGTPEDEVWSVASIPDGNLWIGTFSGLRFLVTTFFEIYDKKSNDQMHAVVAIDSHPDAGRFVATYSGLLLYEPESNDHISFGELHTKADFIDEKIMAIEVQSDGIWIGYRSEGLQFVSLDGLVQRSFNTQSTPSISSNSVSSILTLWDGTTIVGTYGGGVNVLTADNTIENISVGNNHVIMLHQTSDGSIWIGTETGLFEYHPNSNSTTKVELPIEQSRRTYPFIWDMIETNSGDLWLATMHHGVYTWPSPALINRDYSSIKSLDFPSLPFDTVYSLEKDLDGNIWGTTSSGLARFEPLTGSTMAYSYQQGLPLSEFDFAVSHIDAEGFLYFGGNSGYTRFHSRDTHVHHKLPSIAFTKILLSDYKVDLLQDSRQIDKVELSFDDHYITFQFAIMDFLNPEKNQYRYMLEGFDDEWIENGTRNTATYTNLPAGDYVLRVQGANSAGIWNREGISLDVHMSPPPWLSWWAYCLYAFAGAIVLWLMRRAYDSYMIERRAAALAVKMNLDAERAEDELQEQLEIQDQLVKSVYRHNVATLDLIADFISTQSGLASEEASGIETWNNVNRVKALVALEECVYHHNDCLLADLNKYTDIIISRLLEDSVQAPENITTINEVSSQPFPLTQASLLSVALYELLENALQHAFPVERSTNYLHVVFTEESGGPDGETCYRLTVEDDGIGMPGDFDPLSPASAGLAIVKSMADQLGGTLSIDSRNGTRVSLSFPAAHHD